MSCRSIAQKRSGSFTHSSSSTFTTTTPSREVEKVFSLRTSWWRKSRSSIFNLLGARAGIPCEHEAGANGDLWILSARHREQRQHAEEHGEAGEDEHHR